MSSLPLYQEIENAINFLKQRNLFNSNIPKVITDNIKQHLRPYQIKALENFIFYNTDPVYKKIDNKHLLFHMATGSGKTNIIAATILYLYEQGYRDFIFFVNTQNIITKTKANLIDKYSSKYLFKDTMQIDVNEITDSFDSSKSNSINIMFTTINKLHGDLELLVKENSISYADFENRKIALIADEAHHLNSEFKKGKATKTDEENNRSWSTTKNNILKCNKDNILLEFTATAEINNNPAIKEHYKDKIIAEYPLIKFREDKYSKDIRLVSDGLNQEQRILQSLMVSEYRQMVAERDLNLNIKPVILFKNKTKDDTDSNFEKFIKQIDKLSIQDIEEVFKLSQVAAIKNLYEIVKADLNSFATRLKRSFEKEN
ncbi:DEAD/DEAH box helicase family protein [Francisella tularensis]|uniref:DEAD/DEAH box helicase family protein n=1 Tax=Francisella tularensis TaxID=263 RepID=UPI0001855218|nr:DEAD/DEAH box helicase family protein [Francisella tularensis]EDZ90391.1 restriction modification system-R protein [Francisella tularensis subsp. novicida FTG]MBK2334687.1 DEAD/DEAH box helicase family protein [Francisella tularensis subsp. novicida]